MTIFRPRALLGLCGAAVLIAIVPFRGREIAEVHVPVSVGAAPNALSGVVLPPDASQSDEELAAQFSSRHIDEAGTASLGSAVAHSAVKSSYASVTDYIFIAQQFRREWKKSPTESGDVVHLPEATALIVGVGGIGSEAARLLSAFGVFVLGTDARRTTAPDGVAELHRPEALDELLPRADFVILTVPHTPATEGLFDRPRFQRMKPTAFFINIGRGMTTNLDDVVTALEAGEIAGAALDVYEQEPLPRDHRLWTLPNVLLTPHMAGHGPYLNDRRFQIIADNCRAFAGGRALRNVVDKSSWF